jgi:MraZ protein
MVLVGEYTSKVTAGRRIAVPKNFLDLLGKELIVTKGFEQHLILVNQQQFALLTRGVSDQPFISGEVREVTRYLMGGAYEVQADAQGRFVIPEKLLAHGGIRGQVIFLGLGQWVEIWDEDMWKKHELTLVKHSGTIANRLAHLHPASS